MANSVENKAIYPGSFDPPTNGHRWVMGEVADRYSKAYIAIGINAGKNQGRFPIQEREQMLNEIIAKEFPNLFVTSYIGLYLGDFAETLGATDIIRGMRNSADFDYESGLAQLNATINPKIKTVSLVPPKELLQISSSTVMNLIGFEGWESEVSKMVPNPVFKRLELMQFERDKKLLENKWQSLCNRLGVKSNQSAVFEDLFRRYTETNRKYHNISHLKTCFNEFELVRNLAEDPDALEMAIWFHDAIYKSNKSNLGKKVDDEGESAELAGDVLTKQMGLGKDFANKVASIIMATKHNSIPEDKDAKLMIDIDLAILGRSPRLFDIYERDIRREWSGVPNAIFAKGRSRVLTSFLSPQRQTIYQTSFFQERYEEQAKKNLQNSIAKLSKMISNGIIK